jgi:selenide,water dikinase
VADPNLLVGLATGDDAAVYRISDDLALVQTVDFFPPVVDDPYLFGAISAANSLSDIYATGARPMTALNIVAFPKRLPLEMLKDILRGGADKAAEAGVPVVGGHTIDDAEPKYGMAVTGVVRPGRQLTNAGALPGDVLILTKPLGSGVITSAAKADLASEAVFQEAVRHMATLNKAAAEAMLDVGVNACTDITGFGLLGHLRAIATASAVAVTINFRSVPIMPGAWCLAVKEGLAPGGTNRNRTFHDHAVTWDEGVHPHAGEILYDPQTSGGLLISVAAEKAERLVAALGSRGVETAAVVGEIIDGEAGSVRVTN